MNPDSKAFFIMLAAHDGPETGEDGPTHHGLFWMSLFTAYPGIKVYKPLDANEAIEMLFHAAKRGEPVVFSAVRPGTPVLKRGNGVPPAREAVNGAYVFKRFRDNDKPKKVLVVSGGQVMANLLEILPDLEKRWDVKIVAVTSPQLFEELRRNDPGEGRRRPCGRRAPVRHDAAQRLARLPLPVPAAGRPSGSRHRNGPLLALRQAGRDLPQCGLRCEGAAREAAGLDGFGPGSLVKTEMLGIAADNHQGDHFRHVLSGLFRKRVHTIEIPEVALFDRIADRLHDRLFHL